MTEQEVTEVIEVLSNLQEDNTVPRNVRNKLQRIIEILDEEGDKSMRVSRALNELEEIGEDINIEPYTRTQLWNIASMLEKL